MRNPDRLHAFDRAVDDFRAERRLLMRARGEDFADLLTAEAVKILVGLTRLAKHVRGERQPPGRIQFPRLRSEQD
jgi:hypothetical protein